MRVKLHLDKDIHETHLYRDLVTLRIAHDIINSNSYMKYFADVLALFREYYAELFYLHLYD